jgi:hypothetical protein
LYIDITAYDQFGNVFENAFFTVTCDLPGPYTFRILSTPAQSGYTDSNGNLQFIFSSTNSGSGSILIMDQLSQPMTVPITVVPLPDCGQEVSVVPSASTLVIGRDFPIMSYSVLDQYGNGVPNIVLTLSETYPNPYTYSMVSSSSPEPLTYMASNYDAAGVQNWELETVDWCGMVTVPALTWYWGVDCALSSISLSSNTPLSSDGLTVTGTMQALSGATLSNSYVSLSLGGPSYDVYLTANEFTYTLEYDPSITGPLYVSLEYPYALGGCSIGGSGSDYSVTWTVPPNPPLCGGDYSTISTTSPNVLLGLSVLISIEARDAGGSVIADLPWSFNSVTHPGTPQTGTTGLDGSDSCSYTTTNLGSDTVQVTFGSGEASCSQQITLNVE